MNILFLVPNSNNTDLISLSDTLLDLSSETANSASDDLDAKSAMQIARLMNTEDQKVALAVEAVLQPVGDAIDAAAHALRVGGRIIYVGAGTSGRLGVLDASEIPPTFSAPNSMVTGLIAGGHDAMFHAKEGAEDDPVKGAADLKAALVTKLDFVVGIAASGRTPYVLGAIQHARSVGAKTAGISCNVNSPLEKQADIAITPIVGPEILAGSTRLKSGTAQKQILNMISTGAMVQIGKCFGNRMVDLKASNEKLKARAINLVADLAPTTKPVALAALIASDWDIKIAILTERTGLNTTDAGRLIDEHDGHLRRAIDGFKSRNTK